MSTSSNYRLPACIVSGSIHPELAEQTAEAMGLSLGDIERKIFPNTERYIRYNTSVRGHHVIIIQSLAVSSDSSVNDALIETLLMIDAAKRASSAEISVVLPYMAYSRQDRKATGREPISAAAVIRMIQNAGADRIVSIDIHSPQTQAIFNGPFDHLTAEGIIRQALQEYLSTHGDEDFVMVSPDGGRAQVSEHYARQLGIEVFHMPKSRSKNDSSKLSRPDFLDGVDGKICFLVDDMIDTAGTLVTAAEVLKQSGATKIITATTHGLFSDPAIDRLKASPIDVIYTTDTLPTKKVEDALENRIVRLPIAPMLGAALTQIIEHGSVSDIFKGRNYL